METAFSNEFARIAHKRINPYGDGNTSKLAVEIIKERLAQDKPSLKKKFYNIDCEV
jgi:UDP-N-acetylglucosamine 2-epimerase